MEGGLNEWREDKMNGGGRAKRMEGGLNEWSEG